MEDETAKLTVRLPAELVQAAQAEHLLLDGLPSLKSISHMRRQLPHAHDQAPLPPRPAHVPNAVSHARRKLSRI